MRRWIFAVLCTAASIALRGVLDPVLQSSFPFVLYFPAVLASSVIGGLGPGIFAAFATGAAAFYFLAPPLFSVTSTVAVSAYWLSCTILVWLGAQQKQRQLILQRLVDERTAELQGMMETFKRGAYHDPLTDLPNRAAFLEELQREVAHAKRRNDYCFAVIFIDLDRFKVINDTHGHSVGDAVLVETAKRIRSCLRQGDVPARLGGDEFAILYTDLAAPLDSRMLALRVQNCVIGQFDLKDVKLDIRASLGVAIGDKLSRNAEDILADSDAAMYEAKRAGGNDYSAGLSTLN